jgi:two-component system, OmpR family, alkaline phosphatase synthesis response regulator PhoP
MARWRVMAVDDDPDILELIEMTLGEAYDILSLAGPLHMMEMVDTFEPDLIILDIMMPKVTGYQLIEALRERKDTAKIPVIFLSAKDTIRDQKYGYKLGATIYLTKPFQPERLMRNIGNIFEHTPPERRPKRWTFEESKQRRQMFIEADAAAEAKAANKAPQPPGLPTTVHHREVEAPGDSKWRG